MIFKRIAAWIAYEIREEKITLSSQDAKRILMDVAPPVSPDVFSENRSREIRYDLTIIVPVYNSENWLKECMESIVLQKTKYSFQIIAIDDGSTDRSGQILNQYIKNPCVEVIRQENKGYSGARNAGLERVKSKYIMFVDSDDVLLPNAIECLLSKAYLEDADIVEGNGYRFDKNGFLGMIKKEHLPKERNQYWGGPCLKVMKAKLWEGLKFPEGYWYEDAIIGAVIFPMANKVDCLSDAVYAYRIHGESITQKHDENLKRVDSYWIMLLMAEIQKKMEIPFDYENYQRVMRQIVFTCRRIVMLPEKIKRAVFAGECEFVCTNFKEYLKKKDRYYFLAKAILNKDYAKYSIYCQEFI